MRDPSPGIRSAESHSTDGTESGRADPRSRIPDPGYVKILLIRLRLIGDVVFTTPLLRALQRTYPDAHLAYLVEPPAAPVVTGNPNLDDVIVAPQATGPSRIVADLRLGRHLRRERYDLVLDLHGGPRSAWLAWLSGAPQRIGYEITGRTWMYTKAVPRPRALRARHSVRNQWDLLEAIEGWRRGRPDPSSDAVEMARDPQANARIAKRLDEFAIRSAHELVVIHVSAGNPFRRWPEPAFTALVSALAGESSRRRIVLSSGPSDRAAAARIATEARRLL